MKLDMSQAWNHATTTALANKEVLGIVAAAFFFLPTLAISILAPSAELEAAAANPDQFQAAMMEYLTSNWPLFLIYVLATTVGTMTVFALLGKRQNLTVGEAIKAGLGATLPYLAASLLIGLAAGLAFGIIGAITAATGSPAIGSILGIILAIALFIALIRFLLVGPAIAIEGTNNPIAALGRSWALVKGNTRRVFGFVFLLIIAVIVISSVIGIVFGLVGALVGGGVGQWIEAVPAAIVSAVTSIILMSVYTSIYHQLAGGVNQSEVETFE